MLDSGVFLQTFLPVFVGVILSFLLWFGGQWFIGYRRDKKARAAMLREFEEEILLNIGMMEHLVQKVPEIWAQGNIPVHITYRMSLEVYQYIVESGEIRLIKDIHKQRLIRSVGISCSRFNNGIDNTEVVFATLIGKENAMRLAQIRLEGLIEQAKDEKKFLLECLKELRGKTPTRKNNMHESSEAKTK